HIAIEAAIGDVGERQSGGAVSTAIAALRSKRLKLGEENGNRRSCRVFEGNGRFRKRRSPAHVDRHAVTGSTLAARRRIKFIRWRMVNYAKRGLGFIKQSNRYAPFIAALEKIRCAVDGIDGPNRT